MTHFARRFFALGLLAALSGAAHAQVGGQVAPVRAAPAFQGAKVGAGGLLTLTDGAQVTLSQKAGYLAGASVSVPASGAARAAELLGVLSGYEDGLAEPLEAFLKRSDVAGRLPQGVTVDAEPFTVTARLTGGRLNVSLVLAQVPAAQFAPVKTAQAARTATASPVVLRVYSDFQCPYCQQFETQTLPELQKALPADVRIEFHQFPLESIHPRARAAAEASECASAQGKFWVYKDALFADRSWLSGDAATAFTAIAGKAGLNLTTFKGCLAARGGRAAVDAGLAEADRLGLQGTPSVFVNGYAVADPYDAPALLRLIAYARAVDTAPAAATPVTAPSPLPSPKAVPATPPATR